MEASNFSGEADRTFAGGGKMVEIAGEWVAHPTRGYRDWTGTIIAPEAVVAVTLVRVGELVRWAKGDKRGSPEVRLLIAPIEKERPLDLSLTYGLTAGGIRFGISAASDDYRPSMPARIEVPFGKVFWHTRMDEDAKIELGGIIFRRADVKGLRMGLWRPRFSLGNTLSPRLRELLARGRTGNSPVQAFEE